jgi:hypothetical protein
MHQSDYASTDTVIACSDKCPDNPHRPRRTAQSTSALVSNYLQRLGGLSSATARMLTLRFQPPSLCTSQGLAPSRDANDGVAWTFCFFCSLGDFSTAHVTQLDIGPDQCIFLRKTRAGRSVSGVEICHVPIAVCELPNYCVRRVIAGFMCPGVAYRYLWMTCMSHEDAPVDGHGREESSTEAWNRGWVFVEILRRALVEVRVAGWLVVARGWFERQGAIV